jgi:cell division septum initiation protein DivIVA
MSEETLTLDAVVEANEMLQDEVNRLRNTNRVLRTVVRQLRSALTTLREQVAVAVQNDETFRSFCAGEFDVKSTRSGEVGLTEPDPQVKPTV